MSAPQPPTPYPPQSAARQVGSFVSRVLWTAIPFGTLGLLGWVPALHIARRQRTRKAWWWLAGLAAAMVGECVLVAAIPAKGHDDEGAGAGAFVITYMITATVYAWQGTRNERPAAVAPNPYAEYGTRWTPPPTMQTPVLSPVPFPSPAPPPIPAPAASQAQAQAAGASDMAAEIQADLRELRGFLGGEDAR